MQFTLTMNPRVAYPPGVPCWVETLQPDPQAAICFYSGLFGWEVDGPGPMPDPDGRYFVARLHGRDVAGIATLPPGTPAPNWTTYIRVADVDVSADSAQRAGGSVVVAPFDALPAGRGAVLACPRGSVAGIWQAGARAGAQLVNAPGAWTMSTLRTADLAGTTAFYETLFGWQTHGLDGGARAVALWHLPGSAGGTEAQPVARDVVACRIELDAATSPAWNVGFGVDDADAAARLACDLGGRVVVAPHGTPMFRQAILADPAGVMFSISQLTPDRG